MEEVEEMGEGSKGRDGSNEGMRRKKDGGNGRKEGESERDW